MAIFVLYGGMIYGIFPGEEHVSWESHLMGFLSGLFIAFFFRKEPIYVGEPQEADANNESGADHNVLFFSDPDNSADQDINTSYDYKPSKKNTK